jgi:hypothetical protein
MEEDPERFGFEVQGNTAAPYFQQLGISHHVSKAVNDGSFGRHHENLIPLRANIILSSRLASGGFVSLPA